MKILLLLIVSLSLWANIGNIMAIKGSADIKRSGNLENAKNGMVLLKGDNIITAKKSRVQVMLKDSTVITIGANSSFSFEEYLFDGTKNSQLTLRANRGFFRSVTGRIGKIAPERFKVKTASATIGIRGTDFSGDISPQREIFKCYEGAIFIEFEGDIQDLDAGMMAEILKDKFEIKKFDITKMKVPKGLANLQGVVLNAINDGEVPTEVISDVTQIIEDRENKVDSIDDFTVSSTAEDRQEQY